jgi:acyl dehydratase
MTDSSLTTLGEPALVELGTRVRTYSEQESILYALAVGAKSDELDLVYERRARYALPTWACALGIWVTEAAASALNYTRDAVLHVGQTLTLHRPLPLAGSVEMRGAITQVVEKSTAAIVNITAVSEWFSATYVMYVPGLSGVGGGTGSRMRLPDFHASHHGVVPISEEAAVLYRLTGDLHPVHVDPEVAARSGHSRPILHGLCTLGCSALQTMRQHGEHPQSLLTLNVEWSRPVLPGRDLQVRSGKLRHSLRFASFQDDQQVCQGELVLDRTITA